MARYFDEVAELERADVADCLAWRRELADDDEPDDGAPVLRPVWTAGNREAFGVVYRVKDGGPGPNRAPIGEALRAFGAVASPGADGADVWTCPDGGRLVIRWTPGGRLSSVGPGLA